MIIEYTPTIEKTAQDVIRTAINTAKKLNSPVRFTIAGQRYEVTPNVNADLAIQEFKAIKDDYKPEVYIFQSQFRTIEKIRQWVRDRNLHTADPKVQLGKLLEEVGEIAHAVLRSDTERAMDGIGDTVVVLICLAEQLDVDIDDCIDFAYSEIKHRRGKLIDGIFVKEEDLS